MSTVSCSAVPAAPVICTALSDAMAWVIKTAPVVSLTNCKLLPDRRKVNCLPAAERHQLGRLGIDGDFQRRRRRGAGQVRGIVVVADVDVAGRIGLRGRERVRGVGQRGQAVGMMVALPPLAVPVPIALPSQKSVTVSPLNTPLTWNCKELLMPVTPDTEGDVASGAAGGRGRHQHGDHLGIVGETGVGGQLHAHVDLADARRS